MSQTTTPEAGDSGNEVDVIVIGAGIAGVAAAAKLVAAGLTVRVLESRDRVGGRLMAHRADDGSAMDLGATWFWPGEPAVAELVERFGIRTHSQHLAGNAVYHQPNGSQYIDGNPLDVPSFRFSDGADSLVAAVVETLPEETVHLNSKVRSIRAIDGAMSVSTDQLNLTARHVVLAVPPALAVATVEFAPELPERLAGLASVTPVWMGGTTKVVIRYREPFWRAEGLSGSGISHYGPMRELHDMSGPDGEPAAIFGFVPATRPDEPTVEAEQVVEQLVQMFGPAAAEPVEVVIQDWRNEQSTSPPGVERLNSYQMFGHPLYGEPAMEGRLHWASTETGTRNPGHIEGALDAAYRAVAAITADLAASGQAAGAKGASHG